MSFCAICTAEPKKRSDGSAEPLVRRPLGARGALVLVCASCDEEPARSVDGPCLGYRVSDDRTRIALLPAFAAAANRVTGRQRTENRRSGGVRSVAPGHILVRVRISRPDGRKFDTNDAWQSLRKMPWHRELKHIGTDSTWHLFERPDSAALSKARRAGGPDAGVMLEQYRKIKRDGDR